MFSFQWILTINLSPLSVLTADISPDYFILAQNIAHTDYNFDRFNIDEFKFELAIVAPDDVDFSSHVAYDQVLQEPRTGDRLISNSVCRSYHLIMCMCLYEFSVTEGCCALGVDTSWPPAKSRKLKESGKPVGELNDCITKRRTTADWRQARVSRTIMMQVTQLFLLFTL